MSPLSFLVCPEMGSGMGQIPDQIHAPVTVRWQLFISYKIAVRQCGLKRVLTFFHLSGVICNDTMFAEDSMRLLSTGAGLPLAW